MLQTVSSIPTPQVNNGNKGRQEVSFVFRLEYLPTSVEPKLFLSALTPAQDSFIRYLGNCLFDLTDRIIVKNCYILILS
jgi:hypothetical protein